jgi:PAS domain S-box-containing protein
VSALEATALLRRIMEEIDVAVFAFDAEERLQLVNRAGERLLGQPEERMIGHTAQTLGLAERARFRRDGRSTRLRRRIGTVGGATGYLPSGRTSDGTGRAVGPDPHPARRRAPGLAAAGPRAQSRDQQLLAPIRSLAETLTNLLQRERALRMRRPISSAVWM